MKFLRTASVLLLAVFANAACPAPATAMQDAPASKAPAVIYILRHAEKPVGQGKDPNLDPQGYLRAKAIPTLFVTPQGAKQPSRFPPPNFIFATEASKGSVRPLETITPLAQALHMKINHDYADVETTPLARDLLSGRYAGKVVVICWHHGEIPHLAQALGVVGAPKKWDPDVFDQIWEVRWVDGVPTLTILPQRLMPGDAQTY